MARRAFSRSCSNRSIRFWSRLFLKRDCSTCRCRWRFSSSNCLSRSCSLGVRRGACIGKLRIMQVRANVQQILLRLPGPRRFTQRPARKSLLTKYFTPVDNYEQKQEVLPRTNSPGLFITIYDRTTLYPVPTERLSWGPMVELFKQNTPAIIALLGVVVV